MLGDTVSLNVLSLFSGVGGFEEAFRRAGIRTVLSCEIDVAARGVLTEHFTHTLHDDVRTLTADECRAAGFVPDRGIICGGFPCQDLSVAGHRAGLGGSRSGLFWEIVRLADALRPRWLVLENVPGLLSSNDGRDMGAVVGALGELGYWWAYRVLDAQHFGVPQRRRRVVIVGCLGDRAAPVEILLEPESVQGHSTPRVETRQVVTAPTRNGLGGGGADDNNAQGSHLIGFDLAQITNSVNRSNPKPGDPMTPIVAGGQPHIAHALTAEGHDASEDGTGRGTPIVPISLAVAGDFSSGEDIAQTVRGAHGQPGNVATMTAVRRLTPVECERLQGFPDGWTAASNGKPQADSPRYRQMGNAIAVPVFEWVARRLVAADNALAVTR